MKMCDKRHLLGKYVTVYREVIRGKPAHIGGIMLRRFVFRIPCFKYYIFNDENEITLKGGDEIFYKDEFFKY